MSNLPQDPKATTEKFLELARKEDERVLKEQKEMAKEQKKMVKEHKKQEKQQRRSELIEKINDKRYGIADVIINRSYLLILVRIVRLSIFWYFFIWGSSVFLKSVFNRMGIIYGNGIEANGSVEYMFKLFLEFATDAGVLKGLLILILGADLLPILFYWVLGLSRKGRTKYTHPMRLFNPLYFLASFMRFNAEMRAERLGTQLALKMGLWTAKNDHTYEEVKNDGYGGKKTVRGPYKAKAYYDKKGKAIYFEVLRGPDDLTMMTLNKRIQTIKDEHIVGDKKIEFVDDCRKYGLMTKRIKNYNLYISTEMTVKLMLENPLEEAWLIETSDELQFDPTSMTIWNAVGINGETVPLSFKEMAGMVIGGLSGSGKSAGLFTSFVKMVKTGLVDLTIIDGKGGSGEWRHFDKVGTLIPLKRDMETGGRNFEEIADYMDRMVREGYQRLDELSELKDGESNFWKSPITPDTPFKVIVIDECQLIFGTKPKNKEEREAIERIEDAVGEIVKVFRQAGYCVILATQKPTSDTIPTHIRDNCGLALSFRVSKTVSEMATLGDAKDGEMVFATDIPKRLKGMAVMADENGERQMIRYAYLDEKGIERELNEYVEEQASKLFA
ncbi:zonular occludens toxin domain-containing protein [Mammaliicoccus sciuri]|uniref:zonular occludens toxin domain-containing protein n=1 Tax=Mammaliicoccus sciuri TaxID=1296 RepID=UPI003F54BA03